jgi:NitT/TauT family transport system substrate-binding protein
MPGNTRLHRMALGILSLLLCRAIASPAQAEPVTVSVGINTAATDIAFFIADRHGYFRDENIAINMVKFTSAAGMVAPLGTGDLDVAAGTPSAGLYNAVSRGVALRIVADKGSIRPGYEYSTLLIRKDLVESGRYHGLSDLKGMTLAASAQGSGSEATLNEALKKGGLSWNDVKVEHLGFPEQAAALRNHAIDGGVTNEPTVTLAIADGLALRASDKTIYPGAQTAVVIYSDNFARQHHDVAVGFMRAYLRAARDWRKATPSGHLTGPGSDEIIDLLAAATALKDHALYREMTAFYIDPNGTVNTAALNNDLAFFRSRGLVADPKITAEALVDPSFAAAAVASLGRIQTSMAKPH